MDKTVKERLIDFLAYLKIGQNSFEKQVGFSNGYINNVRIIGSDKLIKISNEYPLLNIEWLLTGKGEMIKPELTPLHADGKTLCLYDVGAAAGHESFDVMISKEKIVGEFVVPTFKHADWMIYVRGSSMYPKYSSGDIIACKVIRESRFIQWNKIYVLATREQGLLVKRLMPSENDDYIKAVSDNEKYPPFDVPKNEILGVALVLGAIKLE